MPSMTAHARALLGATGLGVLAAASIAVPSSASAQTARTVDVNLPAMPMDEALRAIAAQTGETINYDPDAVRGLTSRPVRGATNARRAVEAADNCLHLVARGRLYKSEALGFLRLVVADHLNSVGHQIFGG